MATDFRSQRIRTNALIVSRSDAGNASFIIYSGSEATNSTGGISDSSMFNGVGTDVFLFVSGTRTDDKPGSLPRLGKGTAVTLFGGDIIVSGTLYAERQVIEVDEVTTGSLSLSGSLFVSQSANIGQGATINSRGGDQPENDFLIKGASEAAVLYTDASQTNVGIGTSSPADVNKLTIEVGESENRRGLFIDQNNPGLYNGIYVDSEANYPAIITQGKKAARFTQDLVGGYGLVVDRDISEAGAEPLVSFIDDNASNTQTTLRVQQDGTGDILNLFDGATEVVTVLDGGNFGIGTHKPAGVLDIKGDGNSSRIFILSGSGAEKSPDESSFTDTCFFVSGAIGSSVRDGKTVSGGQEIGIRGTATFGGDLYISGGIHIAGDVTSDAGSWTIAGDTGSTAVEFGKTVTIAGTAPVSTTESGRTVTVSLDAQGVGGSYGGTTAIPVLTIDGTGVVTAASTAAISTSWTLAGDSGSTAIPGGSTATIAGDATSGISTIESSGTVTVSLDTTTATPGTYGDATNVAQVVVDTYGRITGVSNVSISGGGTSYWEKFNGTYNAKTWSVLYPKDGEHDDDVLVGNEKPDTADVFLGGGGSNNEVGNTSYKAGSAIFNQQNLDKGNFRVGTGPNVNSGKKGALLVDATTRQVGILVKGVSAAEAYGKDAGTDPLPNDIGLFISGNIGGRGFIAGDSAFGTTAVGGDLVVSGVIAGELGSSINIVRTSDSSGDFVVSSPFHQSKLMVQQNLEVVSLNSAMDASIWSIGTTDLYISGANTRLERRSDNWKSYNNSYYKSRGVNTRTAVQDKDELGGTDYTGHDGTTYNNFFSVMEKAAVDTMAGGIDNGVKIGGRWSIFVREHTKDISMHRRTIDARSVGFVSIHSGTTDFGNGWQHTSKNELNYADTGFFVSGAIHSRNRSILGRGTSLFGGDVALSGALYFNSIVSHPYNLPDGQIALYAKSGENDKLFFKVEGVETEVGSGTANGWTADADNGSNLPVADGATLELAGGDGIISVAAAGPKVTFDLDIFGLTAITNNTSLVGTDEIAVVDDATGSPLQRKIQLTNVKLGLMNNDQGWTNNVGDITSVAGGTGLSGGGVSGAVTLNLAAAINDLSDVSTVGASVGEVLTRNAQGNYDFQPGGAGGMTSFTVAGTSDTNVDQSITDGNTLTVFAGMGMSTIAANTDTLNLAVSGSTARQMFSPDGPNMFANQVIDFGGTLLKWASSNWKTDGSPGTSTITSAGPGAMMVFRSSPPGDPANCDMIGMRLDVPKGAKKITFIVGGFASSPQGNSENVSLRISARALRCGQIPGKQAGIGSVAATGDWGPEIGSSNSSADCPGWAHYMSSNNGNINVGTGVQGQKFNTYTSQEFDIGGLVNGADKADISANAWTTLTMDVLIARALAGSNIVAGGQNPGDGGGNVSEFFIVYIEALFK